MTKRNSILMSNYNFLINLRDYAEVKHKLYGTTDICNEGGINQGYVLVKLNFDELFGLAEYFADIGVWDTTDIQNMLYNTFTIDKLCDDDGFVIKCDDHTVCTL